jgi:hypothetical protein
MSPVPRPVSTSSTAPKADGGNDRSNSSGSARGGVNNAGSAIGRNESGRQGGGGKLPDKLPLLPKGTALLHHSLALHIYIYCISILTYGLLLLDLSGLPAPLLDARFLQDTSRMMLAMTAFLADGE